MAPRLAPPKGLPATSNNRATWTADHFPPLAAGIPRSSKPAAMARRDYLHELPHLFRRERGRDELILEGVGKHEIEAPHLIGPHRALREEVVAPITHEL